MLHEKFDFTSLEELSAFAGEQKLDLPLSEHLDILSRPLQSDSVCIPNRLAIQPMEGCDGNADGSPGELTLRRYDRFAKSGAGLIWFEAVAVVPEGRANPRQLMITEENIDTFKTLVASVKEACQKASGFSPVIIMQATHSGRYSKPNGIPEPLILRNNPIFEKDAPIAGERIVTDEYLASLPQQYAKAAKLAFDAGFDGVDVKCCHGYLLSEALAAFTRHGKYGGSFENRTRLLQEAIAAVKAVTPAEKIVTCRMNLYDGFPSPYGWGAGADGSLAPDLAEPDKLVGILQEKFGIRLLDFTIGNPYVNPHVNRPFDAGPYQKPEPPVLGVARMCDCIAKIKQKHPGLIVVGSGYSYLRQFSANLAAGMVESGKTDIAGFGRMTFAYPAFAQDITANNRLEAKKCCIACGKCSELMRAGSMAGCVLRDSEVYLPLYRKDVRKEVQQ